MSSDSAEDKALRAQFRREDLEKERDDLQRQIAEIRARGDAIGGILSREDNFRLAGLLDKEGKVDRELSGARSDERYFRALVERDRAQGDRERSGNHAPRAQGIEDAKTRMLAEMERDDGASASAGRGLDDYLADLANGRQYNDPADQQEIDRDRPREIERSR